MSSPIPSLAALTIFAAFSVTLIWWIISISSKSDNHHDYGGYIVILDSIITLPNATTLVGMMATLGYVASSIGDYAWLPERDAWLLLTIAILSDGVDGVFVHTTHQYSRLGKIIDTFRDIMLSSAILLVLSWQKPGLSIYLLALGTFALEIAAEKCFARHREQTEQNTVGMIRTAIHGGCGLVFVLRDTLFAGWIIQPVALVSIMFISSGIMLTTYCLQSGSSATATE